MRTASKIVGLIFCCLLLWETPVKGQRIFGAEVFQLEAASAFTVRLDVQPLTASYSLHLPSAPPPNSVNYLRSDASGNLTWTSNALPPLSQGAIWYGDATNTATELPAGPSGSILKIDGSGLPQWTTTLPPATMVPANQIGSGTLPPGTNIIVGNGASIQPGGTGIIVANGLNGSGVGKYSGSVAIPLNSISMTIPYSGITASSVVLVSVVDPSGQTDQVSVTAINPGVNFTIQFSGFYPTTTGQLNYVIIN